MIYLAFGWVFAYFQRRIAICVCGESGLISVASAIRSWGQKLFATLGQISEVIIIGLHELPDNRHREDHNQPDSGPNRNGVVAHLIQFCSGDLNGKSSEKAIISHSWWPNSEDELPGLRFYPLRCINSQDRAAVLGLAFPSKALKGVDSWHWAEVLE